MAAAAPLPQPASIDEALASLDSVPLFMKSLPQDDTENEAVCALQSLAFDGTPDEIAQNFKEQGNDYFKGKRFREALSFYTQGVDAKPTEVLLQEVLLCNRAACNLELKNYGSVLRDCSKALSINPKSSKAFYRSSLALLALERVDEALDCCNRCLEIDRDNKSVLGVRERAIKVKAEKERKEQERSQRILKEKEQKRRLNAAFQERNLIQITNPDGPSENPYSPHFDPEDPTQQTLIIPAFFLYPQHATSDIISHFAEDTPFSAHLTAMFPPQAPAPEWDKNGEYIDGQLVVYGITLRKRLLKIGKKMTLTDVCKAAKAKAGEPRDGLEVKDGCLTFVVLPKGDVEKKWVEDFKMNRES
ncbi:hypothetical protein PILCRDRAFT_818954 [Piloderma croceum F 1598]|uniref:Cns1/TTC4 wheel domain-containing protein n=1 Tax=Piloderma croceum (strain F 1598) TaxID=765440 RepID=A0A0C3C2X2_PILCF|nr:hypothetical protein PILCRDRAFT_818954 [Piloderma croceum F 1598]